MRSEAEGCGLRTAGLAGSVDSLKPKKIPGGKKTPNQKLHWLGLPSLSTALRGASAANAVPP